MRKKMGPMRQRTKDAMVTLAEIMVNNYKLEVIKGTPEFLDYAIHEAEENELDVSSQTIKLRQQFLEVRCDELNKLKVKPTDNDEYDVFEDEEYYWASGDMVDHDAIILRALELIKKGIDDKPSSLGDPDMDDFDYGFAKREIEKQQSFTQQISNLVLHQVNPVVNTPVKNYSMFIESEDGLRVIRGTYKGKYVYEIDGENFVGCAAGWSKFCMNQNEQLGANRKGALTEDDKNVFLDIISGRDV